MFPTGKIQEERKMEERKKEERKREERKREEGKMEGRFFRSGTEPLVNDIHVPDR
jgi:hypothetical protein